MSAVNPFAITGVSQTLSASNTSAATAFTVTSGSSVRIINSSSTVPVFVAFGTASVAATTSSSYLPVSQTEVWTIAAGVSYVAVVTASGTATVYIERSCGL